MRIAILACAFVLALSTVGSMPANAGGAYSIHDVSVQTRDGSAWRDGAPIVLVVRATSVNGLFPEKALSVVMQTDGERTKCLDVAMKHVSTDAGIATYAGVFYPFRAAAYDGRFAVGDDVFEIRFAVGSAPAPAAAVPPDVELPVLPPVAFDYGPSPALIAALIVAGSAALVAALVVLLARRRVLAAA